MMNASRELEKFLDKKATLFSDVMIEMLDAVRDKNEKAHGAALMRLADLIRNTMILADLSGRKRIIIEADHVARSGKFAADNQLLPLTFIEAMEDIVTREPRVVPKEIPLAGRRRWVSELYSREHAFAAAYSASEKLTKRVQEAVQKLITEGQGAQRTENEILKIAAEESHEWARSYAATVYRTNVAEAYNNGRFDQARDKDIQEAIPALEYVAQMDARTRPNHAAAHGLIAPVDHPVWGRIKPPLGYQCRCGAEFISRYELERRGLLAKDGSVIPYFPPGFGNAHPDAGFKTGAF